MDSDRRESAQSTGRRKGYRADGAVFPVWPIPSDVFEQEGKLPTNLQGIWEHYLYTGDAVFLREHFDVLEHCVTFFYDFLIEDEEGNLVTSPSLSPENTYERSDD